MRAILSDVLPYLACPVCARPLREQGRSLACEAGHSFDVAREGYVNLLTGHAPPGTADDAEMIAAREAFLARGLFEPLADAVAGAVAEKLADEVPGAIAEIGGGTGYYLARALGRASARAGIALDISKAAARRAARAHARAGAVVCDAWKRLPLLDGSFAGVLDVFAPRNPVETARILHDRGVLVVATPTPRHLAQAVEALGLVRVDADKERRLAEQLDPLFALLEVRTVEADLALAHDALRELVAMGPSARHTTPAELDAAIAALPEPFHTALAVTVGVYGKR